MNRQLRMLQLLDQLHGIPSDQRQHLLDQECASDTAMRKELERMLAIQDDSVALFSAASQRQDSTDVPSTRSESPSLANMRLQPGDLLLDRYAIDQALGRGGMGEVYRARDLRLERDVAVKLLNLAAVDDPNMRERFERELRSVASLAHPHIVTLHDVATDGELTFAIMELIAGTSLRNMVNNGMSLAAVLKIAADIAAGLDAAHRRNMVHRDIKPENIMVTVEGQAKILDFGIARDQAHEQLQTLTGSCGVVPGTPPYMSPEQAEGTEVGTASDVFSFGTVIYEMLTGVNPFRDSTAIKTIMKICSRQRPQVIGTEHDIPVPLSRLLDSMFQYDATRRPTAGQIRDQLMLLSAASLTTTISAATRSDDPGPTATDRNDSTVVLPLGGCPSVAVLPLQAISTDPQSSMFGDAVSQEVIVELSKLRSLMVISRGSSFQFRGPAIDLNQVGRVLGAKYVLTGTFENRGSKCTVHVELAHSPDKSIVWADRLEVALEDVLQLRHAITSKIVSAIEIQVQRSEAQAAMRTPTENLDAWSAYHRGLWHMYRFNARDNETAAGLFQQAVVSDPLFARAHAGLSFTHFQQAFLNYSDGLDLHRNRARQSAETALQLDPGDPFVNLTMGRTEWLDNNLDGAGSWLDQSLQLCPNYAFAMYNRGLVDVLLNHGEQAQINIDRSLLLSPIDPLNYAMYCTRAFSHLIRRQYEEAVKWVNQAVRIPTAHTHIHMIAAMTHELAGNGEVARQHMSRVRQMDPHYSRTDFFRAFPFRDPLTTRQFNDALLRMNI